MQSFKVTGMTCAHCVRAVTEAIQSLDAAAKVEVDLDAGRVVVRDGSLSAPEIVGAIEEEGYTAAPA
jgi:copper chaperone